MCRFLETICVKNGKVLNLGYHQERVNRTFCHFFGVRFNSFRFGTNYDHGPFHRVHNLGNEQELNCHMTDPKRKWGQTQNEDNYEMGADLIILKDVIPEIPDSGWYKWRVVYDDKIRASEIIPYTIKKISRIFLLDADFDYSYKYEDRSAINRLKDNLPADSAPLFCRNGFAGDTDYANAAFESEGKWYTPDTPFLEGTKRASLIKEGRLIEKTIKKEDIKNYSRICLINAMLDIGDCVVPVSSVFDYEL